MFRKEYLDYSFKCYKRKKGDPRKGDVAVRTVSYLAELPIAFWFPLLYAIKFFAEFSHGLVLGVRQLKDIDPLKEEGRSKHSERFSNVCCQRPKGVYRNRHDFFFTRPNQRN